MRTIPGMVVMCPSDDVEARALFVPLWNMKDLYIFVSDVLQYP